MGGGGIEEGTSPLVLGENLLFVNFFPENFLIVKEIGPRGR